ncbi:MAG: NAD(P)/FAD-dependent oxidoreductase [Candidatus Tyrphobacter sp.]
MNGSFDADVAVVGSGIIGTMTALALQDAGLRVVAIEEREAGAGTASGSAGYVHDGEIFPLGTPQLLATLPRLIFDPLGPLVFRLSYAPRMAGWGLRFLQSMRPSAVARATEALASLNRLAVEALASAAAAANAQSLLVHGGGLKVARTQRTLAEFKGELATLQRVGIPARAVGAEELRSMEPAVGNDNAGALFFPNSAHCVDPALFGRRLATLVRSRGSILHAHVDALVAQPHGTWVAHTDDRAQANVRVRSVIVCAGHRSNELLRPLGYRVPIAAARGYHLMLERPGVELRYPIIFHEPHFAATPMSGGMRLAGTMEFSDPDAPPDLRRAHMLYDIAQRYIPDLRNGAATTWMGVRPAMPDSLPAIGRARHHDNLYYGFGHGHLGFTQAAITARCIAGLLTDRTPPIDLTPFDLARFS